jgi:O-antigen ligase
VGTFSRAAWISLIPALMVVIYFSKYRKQIFIGGAIICIVLGIVLYQNMFFKSFVMRLGSVTQLAGDSSNATRIYLVLGGLSMFVRSFFWGVGFRGFPILYEQLYRPSSQELWEVIECHTLPIEILAELGIIGLVLSVIIITRYFRFASQSIGRISNSHLRACQIGITASMVGFFINYCFNAGGIKNNWFWIGFGITFAIDRASRRDKQGRE